MGLAIMTNGMLAGFVGLVLAGAEPNPASTTSQEAQAQPATNPPVVSNSAILPRDTPRVASGVVPHSHAHTHAAAGFQSAPRAQVVVPAHVHTPAHARTSPHAHASGHHTHGWILPPGPGLGWGFPNNAADGYGYVNHGWYLPLGANRTPDYHFPRQYSVPADQMFFPTYYNPFTNRGQRYLTYTNAGGAHPAGGPPTPESPYTINAYEDLGGRPSGMPAPRFNGQTDAPPVNANSTGLTP